MVVAVAVAARDFWSAIESFVDQLTRREDVVAVGLFGGWARYDASAASTLDFLVVGGSGVDFESHELIEHGGLLLDVNHVPWRWLGEIVKPEVDHRLHEAIVLYDPKGLLGKARGFVEQNYRAPGRVDIRTEGYIAMADVYMSRASSAVTRRNLETASVYVDAGLESISGVLMDIAGVPIARESFVWNLRRACEGLGLMDFYRDFIDVSRLSGLEARDVVEVRRRFEGVWRQISGYLCDSGDALAGLHEVLKREVGYLTSRSMLGLLLAVAEDMLDGGNFVGAAVYLRGWLRRLLEGYAWVVSARRGNKLDYTSLFKTIGGDGGAGNVREGVVGVLGLGGVDGEGARRAFERSRSMVSLVRSSRRGLIEGRLG